MSRIVSVLCASSRTAYQQIEGIEIYDKRRDALTFPGDTPIVAHPPCRAWSAFCKHQAKPEPGEKELGLWCCEQLRKCGGVLEQPAFSEMFAAANFPKPGMPSICSVWTMQVWQAWWGCSAKKQTWLAFCGVPRDAIQTPLRLHPRGGDKRWHRSKSKNQRSATTFEFAVWLIEAARQSARIDRSSAPS